MDPTSDWRNRVARVYHLFREGDLSQFPRWVSILVYPPKVSLRAFEEFFKDKCLQSASALAYASLLALVPVTAIFFFFLTKLEAFSEIQLRVEDFLFENLVPTRTDIIREYLTQYTNNINYLGVFGIVALFVTAIFLFNTVEHAINDIWQAKQRRPFLSKFSAFWTVLTATPVLVLVSFYIAARLARGNVNVFLLQILPYLLNWLAFWFAYQFIPYTQIRVRAAVVGAVVGGTLWELAKGGFNWYISHMTSFDVLYGPLGAVVVFLLWIYLTWLIVLLGAEVAYAVQYPQGSSSMSHGELANYMEFYSVRAMAEIARRFKNADGKASSKMDHLKSVGIPSEILGEILNRLSEKQLIVYTEDKEYVPARQPSSITVREVVEAVSGTKMLAPESAGDPVSERLRKSFLEVSASANSALDGFSIETLIERIDT